MNISRIILLFLWGIGLVSSFSFGQIGQKLEHYKSDLSNLNYVSGDTLIIGSAVFRYNQFQSIYKKNSHNRYYTQLQGEFNSTKAIIDDIYSVDMNTRDVPNIFLGKVVFAIRTIDSTELYVSIDEAITNREIVVYPNKFDPEDIKPFDKKASTVLLSKHIGYKAPYNMFFYLEKVENSEFRKMQNDEFYAHREQAGHQSRIDSIMGAIHKTDTFLLILPVSLGKYDFQRKLFPIIQSPMRYFKTVSSLGTDVLHFSNFSTFSTIESDFNNAEFFAKTTKSNTFGDREAFVILKVVVEKIDVIKTSNKNNIGDSNVFEYHYTLRILELHCVDNKNLTHNYIGGKVSK